MSKGSKQRPTDKTKYNNNYNNINWSKEPSKLTRGQTVILQKEVKKALKNNENNN